VVTGRQATARSQPSLAATAGRVRMATTVRVPSAIVRRVATGRSATSRAVRAKRATSVPAPTASPARLAPSVRPANVRMATGLVVIVRRVIVPRASAREATVPSATSRVVTGRAARALAASPAAPSRVRRVFRASLRAIVPVAVASPRAGRLVVDLRARE